MLSRKARAEPLGFLKQVVKLSGLGVPLAQQALQARPQALKAGREGKRLQGDRQRRLGATHLSLQHRYGLAKGFPRRRLLGDGLLRAAQ